MAYQYKYTTEDGKPLKNCPECGHDLTACDDSGIFPEPTGITLELVVSGRAISVNTHLSSDGTLIDTDDGAVAAGFHSGTNCGGCGEQLINMEGVEEVGSDD